MIPPVIGRRRKISDTCRTLATRAANGQAGSGGNTIGGPVKPGNGTYHPLAVFFSAAVVIASLRALGGAWGVGSGHAAGVSSAARTSSPRRSTLRRIGA